MISTEASHEGTAAVRGSLHMGIPRILVIGDYESIRETTSCILRGYGYLMDSVETGKQAIKKSESSYSNAALIDIRLPDLEGTEPFSLKKSNPKKIVNIVTAYLPFENAVKAVEGGADDYVIKPANHEEMLAKISIHLRKQEEDGEYGETKVAEYIETRLKQFAT